MRRALGRSLTLMLAAAMPVLLVLSLYQLKQARAAARYAVLDLNHCQRLAESLRQFRGERAAAWLQERPTSDVTSRIEAAAGTAGIAPENILRITPDAARQLAHGSYREHPTSVALSRVSLEQLISFLHELTGVDTSLSATSIRLTAPHDPSSTAGTELWSAEVTLTYLVFSPKSTPANSGELRRNRSDVH